MMGDALAPPKRRVSVVIPTRNRRTVLAETLAALGRQSLHADAFEVIVVVDGSEDDTLAMLAKLATPFTLTALARRRGGRAASVNAGLRAASGEIAVILDDDISASEGLLEAFAQYLRAHPDHSVVGAAPIAVPPDAPAVLRLFGAKMNGHLARLAQPGFQFEVRDFYSGNFAIRRALMLGLGGYDEDFTLYGNEDCELAHRLIQAGVPIVYLASAVGHQGYTKTFAQLARDTYEKGRTTVLFAEKHPRIAGRLRLEEAPPFSWRVRAFMASVLAVPRMTRLALAAVYAALDWLDRRWPRVLVPRYQAVLDVMYWLGVRQGWRHEARTRVVSATRPDCTGLLEGTRTCGWREALARECSRDPDLLRYATDRREADWLLLLRDIAPGRALFLGNAVGVMPFLLASDFPEVVVSDHEPERLEFARLRAEEEKASVRTVPVDALGADVAANGRFALIAVANGWEAHGQKAHASDQPQPARLESLLEARGTLVYTAGPHPSDTGGRSITSWLRSIVRRRREARQLRAAGFTRLTCYWRRPSHRPFDIYVPLADPGVVQYYLRTTIRPPGLRSRVVRLAARVAAHGGLLTHLVDDPVVIARRS